MAVLGEFASSRGSVSITPPHQIRNWNEARKFDECNCFRPIPDYANARIQIEELEVAHVSNAITVRESNDLFPVLIFSKICKVSKYTTQGFRIKARKKGITSQYQENIDGEKVKSTMAAKGLVHEFQ